MMPSMVHHDFTAEPIRSEAPLAPAALWSTLPVTTAENERGKLEISQDHLIRQQMVVYTQNSLNRYSCQL